MWTILRIGYEFYDFVRIVIPGHIKDYRYLILCKFKWHKFTCSDEDFFKKIAPIKHGDGAGHADCTLHTSKKIWFFFMIYYGSGWGTNLDPGIHKSNSMSDKLYI